MFVYIIWYTLWFILEFLHNTKGIGTRVLVINSITDIVYTMDAVFLLAVFRNPSRKLYFYIAIYFMNIF